MLRDMFIRIDNADRFPGLVLRVKGLGDEVQISYEPASPPIPLTQPANLVSSQKAKTIEEPLITR